VTVTLTARKELPLPEDICTRLDLQPGAQVEVRAEQGRLVAFKKEGVERGDHRELMARLGYVRAGRKFTRDEANER
jgi:antitoxin component of MazEF toxin-antitoxin module